MTADADPGFSESEYGPGPGFRRPAVHPLFAVPRRIADWAGMALVGSAALAILGPLIEAIGYRQPTLSQSGVRLPDGVDALTRPAARLRRPAGPVRQGRGEPRCGHSADRRNGGRGHGGPGRRPGRESFRPVATGPGGGRPAGRARGGGQRRHVRGGAQQRQRGVHRSQFGQQALQRRRLPCSDNDVHRSGALRRLPAAGVGPTGRTGHRGAVVALGRPSFGLMYRVVLTRSAAGPSGEYSTRQGVTSASVSGSMPESLWARPGPSPYRSASSAGPV